MSAIVQTENPARHDGDAGRWETYEVPFEPGQSVLDGLRWLRINRIPSLPCVSPASTPMPARNA